jgi:hypothetical protein
MICGRHLQDLFFGDKESLVRALTMFRDKKVWKAELPEGI